ncbi:hypothetical protein [Absidia glauca]|uniref:Uncharacterized protein n=1 Tax=Absidia glauca TaxID=4829 RepID=A0A163J5J3_ABSGL|nr:hypothetical protein [Absidia glauca]
MKFSFDLPTFLKEVTDYKALPLSLVEWQRVYVERVGLSENTPPNESGQVLPFHPKTLELEIARYHESIDDVKDRYIDLEAKWRFLGTVLQDPPVHADLKQRIDIEGIVLGLSQKLTKIEEEMVQSKHTIADMNAINDKARQALNDSVDDIIKITDEIEAQNRELADIEATLNKYAVKRTPEEARAMLDKQTLELAAISKRKDAHHDRVAELEWQMEDELQEIQALEATLRKVQARAKEAVEKSGQRDLDTEKREAWFTQMTQLCCSMYGVDNVALDGNCIKVEYLTKDQLVITLDPLTELITDISVNNDNVAIGDLWDLAKGQHINDVGSTIVLETLARTRHL